MMGRDRLFSDSLLTQILESERIKLWHDRYFPKKTCKSRTKPTKKSSHDRLRGLSNISTGR